MDSLAVTVPVDGTDPLVMAMAWLITFGLHAIVKKYGSKKRWVRKVRHLTPVIAVLAAAALRSAYAAGAGEPLTLATLLRTVAAGAVAVLGHSQGRELFKWASGGVELPVEPAKPPANEPPGGEAAK